MASTKIGALVYNIEARTEKFSRDLDKANKSLSTIERSATRSAATMDRFAMAGQRLLGVLAGYATATGAISFFRNLASEIDALGKASEKLGILAKDLQVIQKAGEQFAGVAPQQTGIAVQRMVRRIAEAAQGTGEAIGAIQELGLDAADLLAAGPRSAFGMIADAMSKVENQSDRVRLSMKLFDSEGVALVNVLTKGSRALDDMERRLRSMNALLEDEAGIDNVESMNDAWDNTRERFRGTGRRILTTVSPALQQLANDIDKVTIAWTESWKAIGRFGESLQLGGSLRQLRAEIAQTAAQTERLAKASRAAMGRPGGTSSLDAPVFPNIGQQFPDMLELSKAMEAFVGPPRATNVDRILERADAAIVAERENLEMRAEFLDDWIRLEKQELAALDRSARRQLRFEDSGVTGSTASGSRGEFELIRNARRNQLQVNEQRRIAEQAALQRDQMIQALRALTDERAQVERQLEGR